MSIDNLSGQTFGQYELRDRLGAGGMGAVYRAYQKNLKREVAVKVISLTLSQQSGYVERFLREAETSARLENAHIIPIYDFGTQGPLSYIVMRMLTGGSLTDRLQQRPDSTPSLGEIASLLGQLANALDYAHSQGVIHRDIKPSNVMFDHNGTAFVVDFGVAYLAQATTALTGTGTTLGTPLYMPPEQWRNENLSAASDQYALAVMTYQLVTGRVPFIANTPFALMHLHLNEMPTPPQVARANVPEAVALVLQRALAKKPADRFPNVTAFAQAFQRAVAGREGAATGYFTAKVQRGGGRPISSSRPAPSASVAIPVYRQPAMWVAIIIIALLLVVVMLQSLPRGNEGGVERSATPQATAPEIIAVVPSDTPANQASAPTATMTPTPTLAPSDTADTRIGTLTAVVVQTATLSSFQQLQTVEAQRTQAVVIQVAVQMTATEQAVRDALASTMTAQMQATEAAANATLLALSFTPTWTPTPTATPTATFTSTPTFTPTVTPIATATPDPLQAALIAASGFKGSNANWQTLYSDGFQHTFEDGVPMVLVPAGCFMMGSTNGGSDEQPVHEQCFDTPFWIDQTEVTQADFERLRGIKASANGFDGAQRPVESITWFEARDYCALRGGRLPTEAEWEYAARGPDGLEYPWGDSWNANNAVWGDNSGGQTANVGNRPAGASWVGALDMSGNVWEWVSSLYLPYDSRDDREADTGNRTDVFRGVRGGSWSLSITYYLHATNRDRDDPDHWDSLNGVRCARSLS
jgi:formylglycine-generating enzyme required for sulfatase activity